MTQTAKQTALAADTDRADILDTALDYALKASATARKISNCDDLIETLKDGIARVQNLIFVDIEGKNEAERKAKFDIAQRDREDLIRLRTELRTLTLDRIEAQHKLELYRNYISLYKAFLHGGSN